MTAAARRDGARRLRRPGRRRRRATRSASWPRAFNPMAADLAAVDRERRELVANVSHELRTPLGALHALLENLADGVVPRRPRRPARGARPGRAARPAGRATCSTCRGWTPAHAPLRPGRRATCAALLDEAAAARSPLAGDVPVRRRRRAAGLAVAGPTRPGCASWSPTCSTTRSRHSPPGGTVAVTARPDRRTLAARGRRRGPGRRAGRPGAGLRAVRHPAPSRRTAVAAPASGLAIARWVADLHGGTIGFSPPTTTGSRFRVDLPGRPAQEDSVTAAERPLPPGRGPTPRRGCPTRWWTRLARIWPDRRPGRPPGRGAGRRCAGAARRGRAAVPWTAPLASACCSPAVAVGAASLPTRGTDWERTSWPAGRSACCVLSVVVVRDAAWLVALCLLAAFGLASYALGVTRGRMVRACSPGSRCPLAALAGAPVVRRTTAAARPGRRAPRPAHRAWSGRSPAYCCWSSGSCSPTRSTPHGCAVLIPSIDLGLARPVRLITVRRGGRGSLTAAFLGARAAAVGTRSRRRRRSGAHRSSGWCRSRMVDAVFAGFVAAQATVLFGGHRHVLETTGLTYAEYVHQGFGQLTVVTLLTLLVVVAATVRGRRARRRGNGLAARRCSALLCVLTLVVVGVRAVPDAPLPGGVRLHPAAAVRRRRSRPGSGCAGRPRPAGRRGPAAGAVAVPGSGRHRRGPLLGLPRSTRTPGGRAQPRAVTRQPARSTCLPLVPVGRRGAGAGHLARAAAVLRPVPPRRTGWAAGWAAGTCPGPGPPTCWTAPR